MLFRFSHAILLLGLTPNGHAFNVPRSNSLVTLPSNSPAPFHRLDMTQSRILDAGPVTDFFYSLLGIFQGDSSQISSEGSNTASTTQARKLVEAFIESLNSRTDASVLLQYFDEEVRFIDDAFYNEISGHEALLKHLYLHAGSSALSKSSNDSTETIVIDDIAIQRLDSGSVSMIVSYHLVDADASPLSDSRAMTYYRVKENGKIDKVFNVQEPPSPKPGDDGLKLLEKVSSLIEKNDVKIEEKSDISEGEMNIVGRYFEAWNRGDMDTAIDLFAEDCVLSDTQYPVAFNGKEEARAHLDNVNNCLPNSFQFVIDEMITTPSPLSSGFREKVGVLWHVENGGEDLPFTRGCSIYKTDAKTGLIKAGIEIPEKAPPKLGVWRTVSSKFGSEPIRYLPASLWLAYMYIVFLSDGILPGANALMLEERTWIEVRDLSINFFLVSPLLHLPFSPTVHPMLEGVFNLLLSWAAMFAGFLSDERKNKPNLLPFGPIVIGMQFLTSAFLLPYLALRSEERDFETDGTVYKEDMGMIEATVAEWRPLGTFLGSVGTGAIVWSLFGRPEFGDFNERYSTFIDLLSIDRVGSSFLVDLAVFALFQGWFVDDDLKRRGVDSNDMIILRNVAKFIPFFGLATYLSLRPEIPYREETEVDS